MGGGHTHAVVKVVVGAGKRRCCTCKNRPAGEMGGHFGLVG